MPRLSFRRLIWSEEHQHYELHIRGQLQQCFHEDDEPAWLVWLAQHTSFVFHGQAGRIALFKEARSPGTSYWYAYNTSKRQTNKRYLGCVANMTFARLEEAARALKNAHAPSPIGSGSQGLNKVERNMALPSTKLTHPRLPISLVERSRLLKELDAALSYPLTLVSASAGSGKTTLLSAWVAAVSHKVGWLSLDALDNNSPRFWVSVITALRTCLPHCGELALAMLQSPQSPSHLTIITMLINEVASFKDEVILILDDYHVIEDQTLREDMLFLLDHLPANLHLILSSRTDPDLPLSRLRVRRQLVEIRTDDLRFTRTETISFLTEVMGLSLLDKDITILEQRTEGWIAGLQLAALSMRKREGLSTFIQEFAGSHRYLLDYVQQEILARLPDPLQRFLLQTSLLSSMNAALCQAVTAASEQRESQEMLEELERANLFIVPLDEQRQWYRYHDLFRQALVSRLQASYPALVPLLHQRAAHWYERQSQWREAIVHALAAKDYPFAASLMERVAEQFWLSGEGRIVLEWVSLLPDEILSKHARLALNALLRLLDASHLSTETVHTSIQAQVERTIARLEVILHRRLVLALSDAEVATIQRRLCLLRALIEVRTALKRNDKECLSILSQKIKTLPQDEEVSWNMVSLSFTYWLTFTIQGEAAILIPRLLSAKQQVIRAGDHLALLRVLHWLAKAYSHAGQLRQVHRECLEALALLEQTGGYTAMAGYLYRSLFGVYYAWNLLEEAADSLDRLLRFAREWQEVNLLVIGEADLIRLSLARGDLTTAQLALQRLEALVEQEGFANHAILLELTRVQCWLAQGNLSAASDWAAQAAFYSGAGKIFRKWKFLTFVHVLLVQQQYTQAIEMLERFSMYFDQSGEIRVKIQFLALYFVALHQSGKRDQARATAARLFALTEPEGFIRVYLDGGEPLRQALKSLLTEPQRSDVSISYVLQLLTAIKQEDQKRLLRTGTGMQEMPYQPQSSWSLHSNAPDATSCGCIGYIEPLSPQELKVLHLLIAGRTYAEIAQELIVSSNTIKTQVSSIYRKLNVNRRAEAIAQARRLFLL